MDNLSQGQVKLIGMSGAYRGMEFLINKEEYIVGRHPECDLVLKESTISARHCRIQKVEGKYMIADLDSTNGTYLNGEKVKQSLMRHDDRVQFDVYEFIFQNPEDVTRTVISQVPKGLHLPEKDQTVAIPTREPEAPPPTVETIVTPITEKKEAPPPVQKGNWFSGLILGLIIAFLISLGGIMLVTSLKAGVFSGTLLQNVVTIFPLFHLHTMWKSTPWDLVSILSLLLLLAGPVVAGMVGSKVTRSRGFGFSLHFSFWYVFLALIAQVIALKFDIEVWWSGYERVGLGFQTAILNISVSIAYFLVVVFILHFIGSLFAKKK